MEGGGAKKKPPPGDTTLLMPRFSAKACDPRIPELLLPPLTACAAHTPLQVLSMYDAQRGEVESALRSQPGLPHEDRAYNVDTFQVGEGWGEAWGAAGKGLGGSWPNA